MPQKEKDPIALKALDLAKAKGWNQVEFAHRLGVAKNNVTNWLSRSMPAAMQIRAAKVLGVTVEELVSAKSAVVEEPARQKQADSMPVMDFDQDTWEFAREWKKLEGPEKASLKAIVTSLVTKQVDERRQPKPQEKSGTKKQASVSLRRSPKH